MYVPKLFKQEDLSEQLALMQAEPFATVITVVDGVPFVSHLPILAEHRAGGELVLTGHLARANPHGRHFSGSGANADSGSDSRTSPGETLFVFHGPHTYVTPSWYVDPLNVPTWNYAVVHAYGRPALIEDYDGIHRILDRTVQFFESSQPRPWKFELPQDLKHDLVGAIVGFEVRVSRIEGKFKLSQNREPADRAGVLRGLATRTDDRSRRVLEMMSRN